MYPAKQPFIIEGQMKTFHNKHNQKEFMTTKPQLLKKIKGLLHTEKKNICNHENMRKKKSH
jgi:uncharacterized spore protein YtfJ